MYPKDLDGGGSSHDFTFGLIIGLIIGAGLMYWFLYS